MKNINKIVQWIQDHWGALAILGGMFWSFVTALWVAFALPIIDAHIDNRIMKLADDSLSNMVDSHLSNNGGGFRGGFSDITGVPKDSVTYVISQMYINEQSKDTLINWLYDDIEYQHGLNQLFTDELFEKANYGGVFYYIRRTGDYLYQDKYGKIWDANYQGACDCFYYYPPYNNNERTLCE